MKMALKGFSSLLLLFSLFPRPSQAGQQIYLSESPNSRYRVIIEQIIDRRVGDKVFFRYPVSLVNTRNPKHHFDIRDAGAPLVQETEKGTFKVRWDEPGSTDPSSIHFNWSKDSLKLFIGIEVIEGSWHTLYVDINSGKTSDITADLESELKNTIDRHGWDCQEPRLELVKWIKPHLVFLKVTSVCGKNKEHENDKLFYQRSSVLFDTNLGKAVDYASGDDQTATGLFESYYLRSLPTPTPTPEETPTQQ